MQVITDQEMKQARVELTKARREQELACEALRRAENELTHANIVLRRAQDRLHQMKFQVEWDRKVPQR